MSKHSLNCYIARLPILSAFQKHVQQQLLLRLQCCEALHGFQSNRLVCVLSGFGVEGIRGNAGPESRPADGSSQPLLFLPTVRRRACANFSAEDERSGAYGALASRNQERLSQACREMLTRCFTLLASHCRVETSIPREANASMICA